MYALTLVALAFACISTNAFQMSPKLRLQSRMTPLKDLSTLSTLVEASEGAKGAVESYVSLIFNALVL
jgi:hypothetical protein